MWFKKNNTDTPEQSYLRKLLSMRGIFIIYGYDNIRDSIPFICSCIVTVGYLTYCSFFEINQEEVLRHFIETFLSILPDLLGFSLGGYAIIVGFGNSDFLSKIALRSRFSKKFSVYERLNSIFAFNLLCQIFVLVFSICADFSLFINNKSQIKLDYGTINFINEFANCIFVFMSTLTLLVIPYLISNIFIFGQTYHTILKNTRKDNRYRRR